MKTELIEDIANAFEIYISDLRQEKIQYETLAYVWRCEGYEIKAWKQLIKYVLEQDCDFQSEKEASDYYAGQVLKKLVQKQEVF